MGSLRISRQAGKLALNERLAQPYFPLVALSPAGKTLLRVARAPLRELSERFDLSHPDSAADLIRRAAQRLE